MSIQEILNFLIHKTSNTTMKKQLSRVAQCAQAIRVELKTKFPDITFKINSKNYSGGDSVDVYWDLGPTTKEVEAITSKYEYGKFNGMIDMYENTNRIEGLPQTKYLFCHRLIEEEARQQMLTNWSYQEPEQWNRHHEKSEVLYRILANQSFPKGAHNFRIVDNKSVTCGSIEDFYKIEYQEPAKPTFPPASISQSPSENHKQKIIAARFNSRCAETGTRIMKGENMLYNYDLKKCYSVSSQTYAKYTEQPDSALGMVESNEEAYFDSFCQTNNI